MAATKSICECMLKEETKYCLQSVKRVKNENLLKVYIHTYFYTSKPFTELVSKTCSFSYMRIRRLLFFQMHIKLSFMS